MLSAQHPGSSRSGGAQPGAAGGGSGRSVYTKKQLRRGRRGRRIALWTALGVVVVLVAVGVYGFGSYFNFIGGITRIDAIVGKHAPAGAAQNILLVGNDERPTNMTPAEYAELNTTPDGGSLNTDTMIILHIPAGGGSATLISLPRDSWVNIPGYGMNKLNAAYAFGAEGGSDAKGAQLLIKTIENLTGLSIDHYVKVSLLGFYNIANALGPINVCLNEATSDSYSGANFVKGEQTLNAKQALAFVRQRHNLPNGDLDREVRQQYFLSVEAHKLLSAGTLLNPVKLNNALSAIAGSMQTDPGLNMLSLANELKGLSGGKVRSATIPVLGTPTIDVDGSAVDIVQLNMAAIPAFIASVTGQPDAYTAAKAAPRGSVTVTVLNGGAANGAATDGTKIFAGAGFKTSTPGDTTSTTTTIIEYPTGQESAAKAVAALLPGVQAVVAPVSGVTVVLGSDGVMPKVPGTRTSTSTTSSSPKPSASATTKPSSPTQSYSSQVCID